MSNIDKLHIQRFQFEGRTYVLAQTIDSTITVFRKNTIIEPAKINGALYADCAIGDHLLLTYKYNGVDCTKRYKVVGKDNTGLFFICESDPTEEEAVYLELMEIYNKVQKGEMCTDKAHELADEAIVNLLYQKKLNLIADLFLALPKWYG